MLHIPLYGAYLNGRIDFHCHQQNTQSTFLHLLKHLFYFNLFMTAILAAVRWHAIVALICLCLVANDSELFSFYLVSMFFASFKKIPT